MLATAYTFYIDGAGRVLVDHAVLRSGAEHDINCASKGTFSKQVNFF